MTPTLYQGQAEPTELGCVKHGLAHPCEQCSKEVATINDMANSFFSHIAHGDEDHRAWLKRETFAWFNGRAHLYASRLAASSAAPTADLRAAGWLLTNGSFTQNETVRLAHDAQGNEATPLYFARPAGAQLAAVAAPEARIEKQEMGHSAAPGSSMPSAAPLSAPCALDQGARPVRPLTHEQIDAALASRSVFPTSVLGIQYQIARAVEAAHGIAHPVDQQEGGTR